jgi:hypothetical protein
MREFELFSKLIEDDFSKYCKALRIHKALNKRWIVSSLDFFTTPISQLRLVENFPEKLLYEAKQRAIDGHLTNHPKMTYSLKTLPWITEDLEKGLKSAKIHNILDYLIAFLGKLSQIPDLSVRLIEEAKKEIQLGIKQGYIDPEKVIGAATFDWMDYRVTPRLRGRNISKIKEFLRAPNDKLAEISDLTENLILRSKKIQNEEIKKLNEEKPFLKVNALQETKLDEVLEKIEQDHEIFPTKAAWWLDSELEAQLQDLGIQTVYDFIRCPSSKLLKLDKLDHQILETIKRTYGTPIPLLTPEERKNLESQHILCLEELQVSLSTLKLKPKTIQSRIEEILNTLNNPICYLPIPSKYYQTLHNLGVSRIIDFLVWPDTDLHRKTGISYKLIERTKSKISPEEIKTIIDSKSRSISVLAKNLGGKSWQKLLQSKLTIQELYYNLPYKTDMIEELKLKNREIDQLNALFLTPISRIPQIKPIQVAKLRSKNLNSFIDLISWSRGDIAEIIGRDEKFADSLFSDFDQFLPGMPLIDLGVLSASEMKSLDSKGFNTVENVYFCAKKETFGVKGVKWKKIERYQRILETPVAMLQLRSSSDKKGIKISHEGLEQLANNGIDQIIKLVYWSPDELKSILKMSLKRVEELKQSVAIKEHGMPLETVCGYNRKTISTLLGYGIETVEDLYFTASEDMLDEDDELDWSYVKKAMEALELPITFVSGIIAAKYIEKLVKKRIDTIIRFLITSDEELSEILETPPENVENLRKKVNLIQLRESTETSVSILEGLPRKQLQILADEQISTIFDFLTTPDDQIASILEVDLKQVVTMKKDLNFTNIKSIKEEKMVPLAKVSIFDKKTIRKLVRLGVESLADLYYVATPKTFVDSDIEWQEILDAKTILDMPIEISPVPTKEEIMILRKAKIRTVLDLMMESQGKLESRTKLPTAKVKALQDSISVNEIITL